MYGEIIKKLTKSKSKMNIIFYEDEEFDDMVYVIEQWKSKNEEKQNFWICKKDCPQWIIYYQNKGWE